MYIVSSPLLNCGGINEDYTSSLQSMVNIYEDC